MATKVLIVLDGSYRFEPGNGGALDFNYTVLAAALAGAGMQVTRAHRQTDASADHQNFNFATPPIDLRQFDVIWFIGNQGRNSPEMSGNSILGLGDPAEAPQLAALTRLMDSGVGVFATGDHDSIGSAMCGHIPRVRAMRAWYGANDGTSPMPAGFPRNYPVMTASRADTTQQSPNSDYEGGSGFVWFENQSDSTPQPITPISSPAHPILRHAGADITVFPDHMHEGKVLGALGMAQYSYNEPISFDGQSFTEFPVIAGFRKLPEVIAAGQTTPFASKSAASGNFILSNSETSGPKTVDTLSVYDGRIAGVGRVVTGSTFHHYVDINLTGDSGVDSDIERTRAGLDAQKTHGFNDAPAATFDAIKQAFVNITDWLARPQPAISLILERSTFSQAEAMANPLFSGAILVTVDGLKPRQFPGTDGITSLDPALFDPAWAPVITPQAPTGITITPVRVTSDDPAMPPRLQRFTFRYDVEIDDSAFLAIADPDTFNTIQVDAALTTPAVIGALGDHAWIQLVKAANPFMLDLANNNETFWLSSDLRVFPVVADGSPLAVGADRAAALAHLQSRVNAMTVAEFEALPIGQGDSTLSAFPTADDGNNVYNFAVARVRLNAAAAEAAGVRVFFRIVPSPTTALLTYEESMGVPSGSYPQTAGASPIALPGEDSGGTDWLSFPVFANGRMSPPSSQTDGFNVKNMGPGDDDTFFGALIDNNLTAAYLTATPAGGAMRSLPELMAGEHQCIVAQIVYPPAPIPDEARPGTSDKLAQRNLALSEIANPGADGSRTALHTFEIEASPRPIADGFPPDELLLDWGRAEPPEGTEVSLYIPGWSSAEVIALADRFYPRHELRAIDANTVAVPGGGTRYVPVPRGLARRTGVIAADFPLGVKRGQRFDLSVRQVTTRGRSANLPPPKATIISKAEAADILAGLAGPRARALAGAAPDAGAFEFGDNKVLITDLRILDDDGDHAVIIEHPEPALVAAARAQSGSWRETVGAFQLGIPVSVKDAMLRHHLRLLSVMRWRAQHLRPNDRWYSAFHRYVELIADKVRALGGDPWQVPATPDGAIPLPGGDGRDPQDGANTGPAGTDAAADDYWRRCCPNWLALLILLLLLILMILLLVD